MILKIEPGQNCFIAGNCGLSLSLSRVQPVVSVRLSLSRVRSPMLAHQHSLRIGLLLSENQGVESLLHWLWCDNIQVQDLTTRLNARPLVTPFVSYGALPFAGLFLPRAEQQCGRTAPFSIAFPLPKKSSSSSPARYVYFTRSAHLSRFINPCAIISTDRHYPIPPVVTSQSSEEEFRYIATSFHRLESEGWRCTDFGIFSNFSLACCTLPERSEKLFQVFQPLLKPGTTLKHRRSKHIFHPDFFHYL